MTKLIAALAALAVMALAPATALGGKGGTDRPNKVRISGTTVVTAIPNANPPGSTVAFEGTARGTHIGKGTLESTGTTSFINPATFIYSGSSTVTAANGDQWFSTESGTGTVNPADGSNVINITSTTTGGTGRFEGASGSSIGTISNVVAAGSAPPPAPVVTYDTTSSLRGKISY